VPDNFTLRANLIVADEAGNLVEDPRYLPVARTGSHLAELLASDLIPLPEGATIVSMPGCRPLGIDKRTGRRVLLSDGYNAVGALLPQGYTRLFLPGFSKDADRDPLPLFGYTAVAWTDNGPYVAAMLTDEASKWNPLLSPDDETERLVASLLAKHDGNRLYEHLSHCALTYGCLTARNTFFGRWEGALPVSSTCNAGCVGCISEQPSDSPFPSPQTRLTFRPTVDEMVDVMVTHLNTSPEAIISFGQGCEGEPATRGRDIAIAISRARAITQSGYVNINTNAGLTQMIKGIVDAGLNLMRVSTISANPEHYEAYYRPRGYDVGDVATSLRYAADHGVYTSINYLVFPGVTDRKDEVEAMVEFLHENKVKQVQMRNLNIDPDFYLGKIPEQQGELLGMDAVISIFRQEGFEVGSFTHTPSHTLR